jgi:hypothetical protein
LVAAGTTLAATTTKPTTPTTKTPTKGTQEFKAKRNMPFSALSNRLKKN